jgi:hypothetical protein
MNYLLWFLIAWAVISILGGIAFSALMWRVSRDDQD